MSWEQGRTHLDSAQSLVTSDPEAAYALLFNAARKALTGILEDQRRRPTSAGGHLAVYTAVRAQLDPPMGATLRPFDRIRRTRRDAEYPPANVEEITDQNLLADLPKFHAIVDLAERVLEQMSPY